VKLKNVANRAAKKTQKRPAGGAKAGDKTAPRQRNRGAKAEGAGTAVKVATAVGGAKAKRAALQAQKRGLNATGKASKMEIDQAVKKQVTKANKPLLKKGGAKGKQASTGLKISFKTADLGKTTDKNVAAQVSLRGYS
jgi:hypothetical protein